TNNNAVTQGRFSLLVLSCFGSPSVYAIFWLIFYYSVRTILCFVFWLSSLFCRVTRVVLLSFSFILFLAMFIMRPFHFAESTPLGVLIVLVSLALCFAGMALTIVGSCLQGICC